MQLIYILNKVGYEHITLLFYSAFKPPREIRNNYFLSDKYPLKLSINYICIIINKRGN